MHVRRVSLTNHIRNFTKRQHKSVSHAGNRTPQRHAEKPVVLANRLIVELAMEAPERREWPRTEAEISPKSLRNCRMIQRNRSRIDSTREAPPTILRASTSPIRLFPPGKATGSGAADRWREICESLAKCQAPGGRGSAGKRFFGRKFNQDAAPDRSAALCRQLLSG